MAYQSKTYSLSDEVVEAIDAARARGLTPNKYLHGLIALQLATDGGEFTTLDTVITRLSKRKVELRNLREKGDGKR